MKQTVTEKLDEILGLEADDSSHELVTTSPAPIVSSGNPEKDLEDDFAIVRGTLHNLIEKGNTLVDEANFFAKEKQDARSVEAASMAQQTARDNALALIGLHKTKKEIEKLSNVDNSGRGGNTTNNTAVFVGSTGDMLKQIRELNVNGALSDALQMIDVDADRLALNSSDEKK